MRVFKFGGASVKDAEAVRNVATIIGKFTDRPLVVVVSAMAKTTTRLEEVVHAWVEKTGEQVQLFNQIIDFHKEVATDLFAGENKTVSDFIVAQQAEAEALLEAAAPENFGLAYDSIVHKGELLSTFIINQFLQENGQNSEWLDTRKVVVTNDAHRRATVDWVETSERINAAISAPHIYLVQGFIGSTLAGVPTTLGREGSDYTASVFAHILGAQELTIWKDVQGVLNGDPKVFSNPVLLEEISYREAIELAYYGASVIHPKTIQPLQERGIPLYVRSFLNPDLPCTRIGSGLTLRPFSACYIRKTNQALISVSTRDLAFIVEAHLQLIYSIFHKHGLTVNTMQNSAVSSSFCVTDDHIILPRVLEELSAHFDVKHNTGLSLYTIRHHNAETRASLVGSRSPMLEQITRETYQVVLEE